VPRATSSAVAVTLLVGIVVTGTAVLGVAVAGLAPPGGDAGSPPTADLSLTVDAETDRVALTHDGGDRLSVANLRLRIRVAGKPLAHQPPVPFFAAEGFVSGPHGPFNSGGDTIWVAGETASLRLAHTNRPGIDQGDRVRVTVTTERWTLAVLSTRAR
jgi:hypothetical protein